MNLETLFAEISKLKVAVVGDIMLDTYWWGNVERISPEAPVPVVTLDKKEHRMGGAANVALNTVSLGAETALFSVTGDDEDAELLLHILQQAQIDTKYIVKSRERITTNKTRVIGRNQQMMRLDSEITTEINEEDERLLLDRFTNYVKRYKPDVVIFEDYNKGVLKASLISSFVKVCKENDIVTAVDPKRKNFFAFDHVDIFKPNLKEVKEALNLLIDDVDEKTLQQIHKQLNEKLNHKISLITLSEKGMFVQKGSSSTIIPSHVRNVADVSGAGDTVIAVASVIYAATKNIQLAADIANIAGGIVCEEVGTVAIDKARLLNECKTLVTALSLN
jgi:D-glycero-beta-D-manno-heptose-7-phosphate kinase